ncbi:MAG: hypothetical protein JKY65_21040 [Planctomycetes bacterium]|nr:hypothetical protein [Planctomycetota bacterium]
MAISHSAELHWTSELRGRAWPYTRGREPQTPTALPELRAEADALLRQLEWPQGHYLRAVMEAPTASPFRDAKGKLSRIDPKRLPTMRKHLERALELDHGLLPARLLLALVRLRGRDLKGALLELDRATPLAPGSNVQSKNLKAYYALEPLGR